MKNLLSENMLRFGTKNLSEAAQRELVLKSIMETINEYGLHGAIRQRLTEQEYPKAGEVIVVNGGTKEIPVPTDTKTNAEASRIIGGLIKAFAGGGTDDAAASKLIYAINSSSLYAAVVWKLRNSSIVKREMGQNFDLVGEFLSTDMTFAAGYRPGSEVGATGKVTSPGALYQSLTGTIAKYQDYVRHLKQFNSEEKLRTETFSD